MLVLLVGGVGGGGGIAAVSSLRQRPVVGVGL